LQDDVFVNFLGFEDLISAYEKERDKAIGSIQKRYIQQREQLIRAKLEGIRQDQYHRRILNACIFPFSESGAMPGLGFSFVRASPLEEKGESNLDFLIYNPAKKIALWGEAKGK
jgi:hypothetical protein